MTPTALFIAALILLPAFGLVIWAWVAMARVEAEMRSHVAFDASHFEIGPQAAADGARWPIPG